jgi:uncharacterized phage-associated protein
MISFFQEEKATQLASYLLTLEGGHMNYMKLIKLFYIIDRMSLMKWGYPVTGDEYFSLDHGPIVSKIKDLITDEYYFDASKYWKEFIEKDGWEVRLTQNNSTDCLSQADIEIADQVYKKCGKCDQWELEKITHRFKEWQNPKGSRIPIEYFDILCQNHSAKEAKEISHDLEEMNKMSALFLLAR